MMVSKTKEALQLEMSALVVLRDGLTDSERTVWAAGFAAGMHRTPLKSSYQEQVMDAALAAAGAVCGLRLLVDPETKLLDPITPVGAMAIVMGSPLAAAQLRALLEREMAEVGKDE